MQHGGLVVETAEGDLGFPGPAATQCPAFRQKVRAGGTMDGAVHSAAAQKGGVGGG